jgi:hypothetical protein
MAAGKLRTERIFFTLEFQYSTYFSYAEVLIEFLYELADALERHYAGQLMRYTRMRSKPYATARYHGYPLRRPAVLKTCVRAPEGWAVIRSELTSRTVTANFSSNPWPRFGAGTWKTGAWRHIY